LDFWIEDIESTSSVELHLRQHLGNYSFIPLQVLSPASFLLVFVPFGDNTKKGLKIPNLYY
jgi:hypothetical protein